MSEKISANRQAKAVAVAEIKARFENCESAILIDYRGLTVGEDSGLRKGFREAGVEYVVLKNTLIKLAVDELGITGLDPFLNGPTAVAFGDAVAPSRVISEFIKKTKKTEIKVGVLDGQVIDVSRVQALADLPPKPVLIAKIAGSLNAPISGFVNVLSGSLRKLVYALEAVRKQKEEAA